MPNQPSERQYGVRPSPDVVDLLEAAASRRRTTPTTLATRLLEEAAREKLGGDQISPPVELTAPSVLYEMVARLHFLVLAQASTLPADTRDQLSAKAHRVARECSGFTPPEES